MSAGGIIFANNTLTGEAIRDELGLKDWIVVSPRTLDRLRARIIEPRILAVATAEIYNHRDFIASTLGTETPAMYWLTGSAL